jgi:hypothetical protein
MDAAEPVEEGPDLVARQDDREALGTAGPHRLDPLPEGSLEDGFIKEQQGAHRLVLRRRRDAAATAKGVKHASTSASPIASG